MRVDGIHLKVRLEQDELCLLVMIEVRADGTKETSAIALAASLDGPGTATARRSPCQVASVKVFTPRSGVAEVAARVRQGTRSRAVAARLENVEGQWTCTALEVR